MGETHERQKSTLASPRRDIDDASKTDERAMIATPRVDERATSDLARTISRCLETVTTSRLRITEAADTPHARLRGKQRANPQSALCYDALDDQKRAAHERLKAGHYRLRCWHSRC